MSEELRIKGMPDCTKCGGSGMFQYDHNHSTVCNTCCPHDQGWWLLLKHYGEDNGRYCCKRGCGHTLAPSELGIDVPQFVSALPVLGVGRSQC